MTTNTDEWMEANNIKDHKVFWSSNSIVIYVKSSVLWSGSVLTSAIIKKLQEMYDGMVSAAQVKTNEMEGESEDDLSVVIHINVPGTDVEVILKSTIEEIQKVYEEQKKRETEEADLNKTRGQRVYDFYHTFVDSIVKWAFNRKVRLNQ